MQAADNIAHSSRKKNTSSISHSRQSLALTPSRCQTEGPTKAACQIATNTPLTARPKFLLSDTRWTETLLLSHLRRYAKGCGYFGKTVVAASDMHGSSTSEVELEGNKRHSSNSLSRKGVVYGIYTDCIEGTSWNSAFGLISGAGSG